MGTQSASKLDDSLFISARVISPPADKSGVWYEMSSARACLEGEELLRQGAYPHGVYLIARGYVKLSSIDQDGRELIVGLRTAGSMLGASAVILEKPYRVSATAITSCELRYLPTELFTRLLTDDAEFSGLVRLDQSRECYGLVTHLSQLGCSSAPDRLEELLRGLISSMPAENGIKELHLELPLKRWEVAQLLAVTPEHLSRIVAKMEQEGILKWKKRRITIFEPQRLQRPASL